MENVLNIGEKKSSTRSMDFYIVQWVKLASKIIIQEHCDFVGWSRVDERDTRR